MSAGAGKDPLKGGDRPGATPTATGVRQIAMTEGRIDSRDLFMGTREIVIAHGSDVYRLRLTALNKLILTK